MVWYGCFRQSWMVKPGFHSVIKIFSTKKGKKAKYIQIKTQIIKITHSDLWSKGDGHKSSKFPYTEIILQTNLLLKQKGNKNTFFLWLQI